MITMVERRDYAGTVSVALGDGDTTVELGTVAAEAIWMTADPG